jgi:hypothetical protein
LNVKAALGIVLIALLAGAAYYFIQTVQSTQQPTMEFDAKKDGVLVPASFDVTFPDGGRNITLTNQSQFQCFWPNVALGHYSVVCTKDGVAATNSPHAFDISDFHKNEYFTFIFGTSPPPQQGINNLLTFSRRDGVGPDPFYLQANEIENVAFVAGGIMVKSGGAYTGILLAPYHTDAQIGVGTFYSSGMVYAFGTTSNGMIAQFDRAPFILFRSIYGTVTIPAIDGYSVSGSGTLTAGQAVIFYKSPSAPTLGTYLTDAVERNAGFRINLVFPNNAATVSFGVGYGSGEGHVTLTDSSGFISRNLIEMKYPDGTYRMPGFPIVYNGWWHRTYGSGGWTPFPLSFSAHGLGYCQAYKQDPNTISYQGVGYVTDVNYISNATGWWGWSMCITSIDTNCVDYYVAYYTMLYKQEDPGWKVDKYLYIHTYISTYNYDEGGSTTGLGLLTTSGHYSTTMPIDAGYTVDSAYYAWMGSSWSSYTFPSSTYVWQQGVTGDRITFNTPSGSVHVYTKFLYSPTMGGSPRIARYPTHIWLNHYYTCWADTYVPDGASMAVEEWYSTSDSYESTVPATSVQQSSFYLAYFP